ncbi:hypothetical protein ALQ04_04069 [Pseudomonas cichorii]|uniref:Lipoprotein n=1 Tax=Pseudomonas cichorii TaxID=36746 RepID=A0A3M4M305_PSECI|nr:hypothetical protein [Pseudomonas cichorii]RMQ47674.1 hypothetical protein ALQ04_04069 [Pseudomonas cichorii]
MNKNWIILAAALSTGCAQMDSIPEVYARSQWKGLPAEQAVEFFGKPNQLVPSPEFNTVKMRWLRDTSVVREEVVGRSSEMQGNVMVHTNHMGNVGYSKSCTITVTVDKQMKIIDFDVESGTLLSQGCAGIDMGPP